MGDIRSLTILVHVISAMMSPERTDEDPFINTACDVKLSICLHRQHRFIHGAPSIEISRTAFHAQDFKDNISDKHHINEDSDYSIRQNYFVVLWISAILLVISVSAVVHRDLSRAKWRIRRSQKYEDKSTCQHKTRDHSEERMVQEIESITNRNLKSWCYNPDSALKDHRQRVRISKYNSHILDQSEVFEMLREITDDVQESSSSPFKYVSSKSTTAQNRASFVSSTEDTRSRRKRTLLYKRRYSTRVTSNSLNSLSWQLSLSEHEHMKTLSKSVSRKFLQVCSSVSELLIRLTW